MTFRTQTAWSLVVAPGSDSFVCGPGACPPPFSPPPANPARSFPRPLTTAVWQPSRETAGPASQRPPAVLVQPAASTPGFACLAPHLPAFVL